MKKRMLLCAVALSASAGLVSMSYADVFSYNYVKGAPGAPSQNSDAGSIEAFTTTFDTNTKSLTFSAVFGPKPGNTAAGLITKGFWLALDAGPDPKGHPGEMALFYFDAKNLSSPLLSIYAYNGVNGPNSWQDGNPSVNGNQPGDLIKGAFNTSSYLSPLVASDSSTPAGPRRTLGFSLNASSIISHTPLYPDPVDPWFGTGFNSKLGIWFHPVTEFNATYSESTGAITSLGIGTQGWIDASNLTTNREIPAPGAAGLLVLGGMTLARRRR